MCDWLPSSPSQVLLVSTLERFNFSSVHTNLILLFTRSSHLKNFECFFKRRANFSQPSVYRPTLTNIGDNSNPQLAPMGFEPITDVCSTTGAKLSNTISIKPMASKLAQICDLADQNFSRLEQNPLMFVIELRRG